MEEGFYDGYRSGFDCSTWTRTRFNQWDSFPNSAAPLWARQHALGLPANMAEEREHTDKGTCMAYRSFSFARGMTERGRRRGLLLLVTIEQLAIPEDNLELLSAYLLASGQAWLLDPSVQTAEFNSCVYGLRSLKARMQAP